MKDKIIPFRPNVPMIDEIENPMIKLFRRTIPIINMKPTTLNPNINMINTYKKFENKELKKLLKYLMFSIPLKNSCCV